MDMQEGGVRTGDNAVFHGPVAGGDQTITYNITYRRVELEAPLRAVFDPLIADRRAAFGGRRRELARINEFLRQESGGVLAITAAAGFGKTSLMAKLAGDQPQAFAYHFFTPLVPRSLSEEFFLRNIVQQMAAWHGEAGSLPAETDMLAALYHNYLERDLQETRILLLDGLDEVTRWQLAPYLGRRLPDGLQLIVTLRDVGQDWRQVYGFPAGQLTQLPLGGLSMVDIYEVLAAAGGQAADLAGNETVLAEISRLASFDQQQAGADPFYVAFLAQDLAEGAITPQELAQQPAGLDAYLDGWWRAIRDEAGDQAARDLFGTLAAALGRLTRDDLEALNESLVDEWAGDYFAEVLQQVRRFVSGNEEEGYALAHPRLQEYLQDPRRIKAIPAYMQKLLDYCRAWPAHGSAYALRHTIEHLKLAQDYEALFATIGDPLFREAQQAMFGGSHVSLEDSRLALQIALERDDPLRIIQSVAAYRDSTRGRTLTQALMEAVNLNDLERALAIARSYTPAADWPRLLYLYLAYELAAAGDALRSIQTAQEGLRFPSRRLRALSDAFVVALARLLAPLTGEEEQAVIKALLPDDDPAVLLDAHPPAPLLDIAQIADLIKEIEPRLAEYERLAAEGESEAVMYLNLTPALEQEASDGWWSSNDTRHLLWQLAGDSQGWRIIERILATNLPNPYRRYRDIGLEAVGRATLAAPLKDPLARDWFRYIWQQILLFALDKEGLTFTFDVPILLVNEAARRGETPHNLLQDYTDRALNTFDKWGTRMRAHSGRAADRYFAGDAQDADSILVWVTAETHGYAGLATGHLLAIANRWLEFGRPERVDEPLFDDEPQTLVSILDEQVAHVQDPDFRQQLGELVDQYWTWCSEADPPDIDRALMIGQRLQDDMERSLYFDLLSARWARISRLEGLKAILPHVIDRVTITDKVLARLLRAYLAADAAALDDAGLWEAQFMAYESLATGRPWEYGRGP